MRGGGHKAKPSSSVLTSGGERREGVTKRSSSVLSWGGERRGSQGSQRGHHQCYLGEVRGGGHKGHKEVIISVILGR